MILIKPLPKMSSSRHRRIDDTGHRLRLHHGERFRLAQQRPHSPAAGQGDDADESRHQFAAGVEAVEASNSFRLRHFRRRRQRSPPLPAAGPQEVDGDAGVAAKSSRLHPFLHRHPSCSAGHRRHHHPPFGGGLLGTGGGEEEARDDRRDGRARPRPTRTRTFN